MHAHDVDETTPEIKPRRKRRTAQTHPWYKRYPRDFWDGTADLTLEEDGAYNRLIDWMYELGGPLPNDDAKLAHRLRVHINKWRPIRKRLFALQKLFITRDGIYNHKVEEVLLERRWCGGDTPLHTPPDTPPDLFDNVLIFHNPRAQSQIQIQKQPMGDDVRVTFDGIKIELFGELRGYWLHQFGGDEKRLEMALVQAAGFVDEKGHRPLEARVGVQLSKQVTWAAERAAKKPPTVRSTSQRQSKADKAREFARVAGMEM